MYTCTFIQLSISQSCDGSAIHKINNADPGQELHSVFTSNIRIGENRVIGDCSMVPDRLVWVTANIQEFSHTTVSTLNRMEQKKKVNFFDWKYLVDDRGQRRKDRLVWADRDTTESTLYIHGEKQSISECTPHQTLGEWATGGRRLRWVSVPHKVPHLTPIKIPKVKIFNPLIFSLIIQLFIQQLQWN